HQLRRVKRVLGYVLSRLEAASLVAHPTFQVLAWTHRAEDSWGLRADEVQGRHLLNLDIGLPVEQLRGPIRTVLSQESSQASLVLQAVNRRGKRVRCSIRVTPMRGSTNEIRGAIGLMEEQVLEPNSRSEQAWREAGGSRQPDSRERCSRQRDSRQRDSRQRDSCQRRSQQGDPVPLDAGDRSPATCRPGGQGCGRRL